MTTTATAPLSGVTFGGILRSEWIKLMSLRSTIWCYAILVFLTIGLAALFGSTLNFSGGGEVDHATSQGLAVQASTLSIGMSQLVIAVLGALVITGEYGTGMIRSTLTAVPKRLPALFGKMVVFGVVTFVISFVSFAIAALLTAPLLAANGVDTDFADAAFWAALAGAAGYIALTGVLATAIGTILRNSAGAIAAVLGLILVVPTIVQVFAAITMQEWVANLSAFLPSNAGGRMYAYVADSAASGDPFGLGGVVLEPWQGALVLVAWFAALLALASALLKRRDA
jgi:ABC-2 type transport system permease protein